jgi:glutathione S-transferase
MKLLVSNTSPFVRKIRIVILEKGLGAQISEVAVQPLQLFGPEVPTHIVDSNPLGKIPALLFDDGRNLFDSGVIAEFLDTLSPTPKLFPAGKDTTGKGTNGYWATKRWEAIADGMLDAAVQVRLERVLRPAEMHYAPEIKRQMDKVDRALAVLESEIGGFGNDWHIGSIAIACALSWLDLRFADLGWRDRYPRLAAFEDACDDHQSYASTAYII